MQHFYHKIHGWFNFENLYHQIVPLLPEGAHVVEVGAWQGRSAAYLGVEIVNSGKLITFDIVDTWEGSLEHQNHELVQKDELYQVFLSNMKPLEGYYNPLRMTSLAAAELYADASLDFVLLDASHEYEDVLKDIRAWLPKIKQGGILAGDDYHHTWPGVVQAVKDSLPQHLVDGVTWIYSNNATE